MTPSLHQFQKGEDDKALMEVICNGFEDFKEDREPTRWKINYDKLLSYLHERDKRLLGEVRQQVETWGRSRMRNYEESELATVLTKLTTKE